MEGGLNVGPSLTSVLPSMRLKAYDLSQVIRWMLAPILHYEETMNVGFVLRAVRTRKSWVKLKPGRNFGSKTRWLCFARFFFVIRPSAPYMTLSAVEASMHPMIL